MSLRFTCVVECGIAEESSNLLFALKERLTNNKWKKMTSDRNFKASLSVDGRSQRTWPSEYLSWRWKVS